jgi:hypothetical protein
MSTTIAQVTVPFHVATQLPDGYWHVLAVTPFGYTEARIVTSAELIEIIERLEDQENMRH